jgi:hypothetical protein
MYLLEETRTRLGKRWFLLVESPAITKEEEETPCTGMFDIRCHPHRQTTWVCITHDYRAGYFGIAKMIKGTRTYCRTKEQLIETIKKPRRTYVETKVESIEWLYEHIVTNYPTCEGSVAFAAWLL